jgi:uncharacterized protein YndB with AHSA1/START domain
MTSTRTRDGDANGDWHVFNRVAKGYASAAGIQYTELWAAHGEWSIVTGLEASMTANVMVVIERQYDYPRPDVFRAWTAPKEMARWRGSPGWHVETETVTSDLRLGGRHHHVKVRDNDPTTRVTTDAVFTEYFDPDVFVARQRITGDPGIDPDVPLELRVEFTKTGRNFTLVRIVQGPYEPDVASFHSQGWELELNRLESYLADRRTQEVPR